MTPPTLADLIAERDERAQRIADASAVLERETPELARLEALIAAMIDLQSNP